MQMLPSKKRAMVIVSAAVMLIVAAGVYWALTGSELARGRKVTVIPAGAQSARLLESEGQLIYRVTWHEGGMTDLMPVEFAELLEADFRERPLYMRLLNVTSNAGLFWVGVGLLAQMVFMARMLVQWAASEKHRRSVVPPMFWWLSLAGASMLIVYFIWRRDAIGVLGQATGWVVYIRNLMLIAREKPSPPPVEPMDHHTVLQPNN